MRTTNETTVYDPMRAQALKAEIKYLTGKQKSLIGKLNQNRCRMDSTAITEQENIISEVQQLLRDKKHELEFLGQASLFG